MEVSAKVRYLRVSPWKVRRYVQAIKGKGIEEARAYLALHPSPTCKALLKLLNSAVANAENNFELDSSLLYIKNITVDGGPMYKRFRPMMRMRAYPIRKRTSHVTLILDFPEHLKQELSSSAGEDEAKKEARRPRKAGSRKKPADSQSRNKKGKEK